MIIHFYHKILSLHVFLLVVLWGRTILQLFPSQYQREKEPKKVIAEGSPSSIRRLACVPMSWLNYYDQRLYISVWILFRFSQLFPEITGSKVLMTRVAKMRGLRVMARGPAPAIRNTTSDDSFQ